MQPAIVKSLRGAAVIAVGAGSAMLLFWLYPYFKAGLTDLRSLAPGVIEDWPEAAELRERIRSANPPESWQRLRAVTLNGSHLVTPLVEVAFAVRARRAEGEEGVIFEHRPLDIRARGDRVIWALALLAAMCLVTWYLFQEPVQLQPASGEVWQGETLPSLLAAEVRHYQRLSDRIYTRSTFILWGALITVFAGLGALYLLPTDIPQGSEADPWLLLTRPYGIVLVLNAVALVLLRQFRASAADYRYMINLRWRRVNCLAVALEGGQAMTDQLAKALLAEVYPEERLRKEDGGRAKGDAGDAEQDETDGGFLATLKKASKPGDK